MGAKSHVSKSREVDGREFILVNGMACVLEPDVSE